MMNQFKNKNISDILKEIIEPDSVDVSSIQMHDTLSPLIWDENEMFSRFNILISWYYCFSFM